MHTSVHRRPLSHDCRSTLFVGRAAGIFILAIVLIDRVAMLHDARLEATVAAGAAGGGDGLGWPLTEHTIAEKLEEYRGKVHDHVGPSFPTIAGYGANGAIIHYQAHADTAAAIGTDSLLLIDSGAQYR